MSQSSFIPLNEISKIQFYVSGNKNNKIESSIEIRNKELFRNGMPYPQGVYDNHLGTTDHSYTCQTCWHNKDSCPGHSGNIELPHPVLSALFKKEILKWLRIICFNCGKPIISISNKKDMYGNSLVNKSNLLNEFTKLTRNTVNKLVKCIHCQEKHPYVFKDSKDHLKIMIKTETEERRLFNHEIEDVFMKITDDTVISLGKSLESHPNKYILKQLKVPPVTVRPDIKKIKGGRSNNNDLTTIVKNIINLLEKVPKVLTEETIQQNILPLDNIEMHYAALIKDSPAGNINKLQTNTGSALMSLASRLPKKTGRIRKNILGKRTTYMGRSVITGDDKIKINEVGVPLSIAKDIQIPETVQWYNIDKLMVYFKNKDKVYPGCSRIIKHSTGTEYYLGTENDNIVLEEGDIIYRDLIDGDYVAMNRAPSLLYSSVSGHIVKVLDKGDTLRLSVNVVDTLYGGDFDGDAMTIIFPHSIMAKNECRRLCGLERWFISIKDGNPAIGVYHDGLIGSYELTKNDMHINKLNAMRLYSNNSENIFIDSNKKSLDGREIISNILPEINYERKCKHYNPDYAHFIDYKKEEIKVNVKRGVLNTGRLDKNSIGQGVMGSMFHIMYQEYGHKLVLDRIYDIQQITTLFQMHKGITISNKDIAVSKTVLSKVHDKTSSIIHEANLITEKLNNNDIIPPLGMTINQYYEEQSLAQLNLGDDFEQLILENVDTEENQLYKLITSGSKGKLTNFIQINAAIGQTSINGERMQKLFDYERISPHFSRFDNSPESRGFVTESYTVGVSNTSFLFQAMQARYSIINKALSTSVTGYQNRKSVKNMETMIIDNHRSSVKVNNIVQFLYGDDGIDNRMNEIVKFKTIMISTKDFINNYKTESKDLDKKFQNKEMQKIIDDEFKQLDDDRQFYRTQFMKIEIRKIKNMLLSDERRLPINAYRIIEDVLYNHREEIANSKESINPETSINKIKQLCSDLEYCYYNEIQKNNNMVIPDYVKYSLTVLKISIRSYLFLKNILKKRIISKILDLIIDKILLVFKMSMIEYGTPIGIITAQSISEPMTQYVLDSHHRTGSSGTKTDFIKRMKEILGAVSTEKMLNPTMIIFPKDEYSDNKDKIQNIANHIEMMSLNRFVVKYQIFFEDYKQIIHPDYVSEIKLIGTFEKHNPNLQIPSDLIKWCIRLELHKETLIEKDMSLDTILLKLNQLYPNIFVVNTVENADIIILRIYISNAQFKKISNINLTVIEKFVDELLNTTLRGINGITSTIVTDKIIRSIINEDGSISKKNTYVIETDGTNMSEIFENTYIDLYKTQSDSILEVYKLLGIEAAREKLIIELKNMMDSSSTKHYLVYADEMSYTGEITSIEKSGLALREPDNILLNMAFSHPLKSLEEAAINNRMASCDNTLSSSLLVGKMPNYGSNYNSVCINEEFVRENSKGISEQLEDL